MSRVKSTIADWQANDYSGPPPTVLPGGFVLVPPEPTNVPGFTGWHVVIRGEYIAIFPNWCVRESFFGLCSSLTQFFCVEQASR